MEWPRGRLLLLIFKVIMMTTREVKEIELATNTIRSIYPKKKYQKQISTGITLNKPQKSKRNKRNKLAKQSRKQNRR